MIETSPTGKVEWLGLHVWWIIGAAGIIALVVTGLVVLSRPPASSGLENGSFENDCCGSLTLRDGDMILNEKTTTGYTVGTDARGAYVLPNNYVGGLEDVGFEIDGARPPIKLRLDRIPNPTNLVIQGGRKTYLFKRSPPNSR